MNEPRSQPTDDPQEETRWTRVEMVLCVLAGLVPAVSAAAGATTSAPASHDAGVVRTVGLGWTGLFRGLDAMVSAPAMFLPIGTRSFRASLASALVVGACGAVAFVIARALALAAKPASAPRHLLSATAAVAVMTALLGPMWQAEGTAPGGAGVGALLVLAAGALAVAGGNLRAMALVLGLAASYEPLVFAGALMAVSPRLFAIGRSQRDRPLEKADRMLAVSAFGVGLMPFAFAAAFARRNALITIAVPAFANPLGERSDEMAAPVALQPFALIEIGWMILVAALAGAILAWLSPRARPMTISLLGVFAVGLLALSMKAPAGTTHVAAPILAASCALHVLAANALAALVVAIARAKVPFAQASAALVVVLGLVLPVRAADESFGRREARIPRAPAVWNEIAWGPLPPAAIILVSDRATMRRIATARATGQMRADLLVVPTFAVPSRQADRALAAEPKLVPLFRDLTLGAMPEELSLTTLSMHRPLFAVFDPRWDRGLARHFVPLGLTARFEPEPRGASDRRRALDAFAPAKERLSRVASPKRDSDLATATALLLRSRAITMAACGERDVLSHALDDLRPFAPDDPIANALVRRIVTSKGAIEVKDLYTP